MNFVSVTADLPSREQPEVVEIMFYVTRVANPMRTQYPSDFEKRLLWNVRARFGDEIDIVYLDMYGEPCDLQFVNRAKIHLVEPKPTVH